MMDAGARISMGSDWPVSTLNPFEIIETAVTRQARRIDNPRAPFLPVQALMVAECVHGYTVEAAAAASRGTHTGLLCPDYSADLILLSQDICLRAGPDQRDPG